MTTTIKALHERANGETELELSDGTRGYLDFEMVTDLAAAFVYTFVPDGAPAPALFLPLVGLELREDTP